jgi:L-ribulose-5-phosphate 4-epimerase
MASVDQLKHQLIQASKALFESGVMSHSGHGNMSARVDGDRIVITAVGTMRTLGPDDFAVVTLSGKVLEGRLDPVAAEIVGMHAGVYRARDTVGSVIHTHSPAVTSFAVANKPLPNAYEAMLRFGFAGEVPVAPWAPRGSKESVSNIVDQLRGHPTSPAVLLGNHGLLAFEDDPVSTARLIVVMEEGAEAVIGARSLGGEKPFPQGAFEWERAHMSEYGSRR